MKRHLRVCSLLCCSRVCSYLYIHCHDNNAPPTPQEHVSECLLDVLHRQELTEVVMLGYAAQAAAAMYYLHQCNVLHCDLAARNISSHTHCPHTLTIHTPSLSTHPHCPHTLTVHTPSLSTHPHYSQTLTVHTPTLPYCYY